MNPIVGNFVICCARTANGRAITAPKVALMKSRRRIASPETQDYANIADYIRDLRLAKWGLLKKS
jgi:hypothetical protein